MDRPLPYSMFKELFKELGINPYDFRVISGENVLGFFPNIPSREPRVSVDRLAHVLWEK